MRAGEKRQANRIIRNCREAERYLFELIEELQAASKDDGSKFDWLCAKDKLISIDERLRFAKDLVNNIDREMQLT